MTQEELEAKIQELESKNVALEATAAKIAELDAKVNPPAEDPDEAYKPKTWKDNQDTTKRIAEEMALKVLKEAEDKKDRIKEDEKKAVEKQDKTIREAFDKLQEEGIIGESKDKTDAGGRQRTQAVGLALRLGGTDVEAAARQLKTLWDQGIEYDYESNTYNRAGTQPNLARMAPVGSSASRTSSPSAGKVDLRGVAGDLDLAQERWEAAHKA